MNFSILDSLMAQPTSNLLAGLVPLVKITCLLVAALVITVTMRRASAGARHLVWLVVLASLLVLPFLAVWAPVPIPVLPESAATPRFAAPTTSHVTVDALRADVATPIPSPPQTSAPAQRRSMNLVTVLAGIWLLGVVVLLARLVLSAWMVGRMVRRARRLDQPEWQQPLFEIADRLGLNDAPQLVQSDRVKLPFASGFARACIVLPAESETWTPERRTAVLIHELGHVRRHDLIGHMLSRLVCALYWFHPLVWSAARRLRAESERACDDLALVLGEQPSRYAEHLLDIVTQVRDHRAPAVAIAMAKPNEFEGRMLAILNPQIRRRGVGRLQAIGLVGSLAALTVLFGVISPAPRAAAKPAASMPPPQDAPAVVSSDETESRAADVATPDVNAKAVASEEASTPAEQLMSKDDGEEDEGDSDSEDRAPANDTRVEILVNTLRNDEAPDTRRVAAWGLANHAARNDIAAQELAEALLEDEDESVREMVAWALGDSRGTPSVMTALYTTFRREKSADVRRTAVWAAGSIGNRTIVPGLVEMLSDRDPGIRELAAWSIGSCGGRQAPAALVRLLSDPEPEVRNSVAWALFEIGDPDAAEALELAFRREKDPDVRLGIIRALGSMGDGAVETLSKLVDSPDPQVRKVAITALAGGNASGPWPWPRPQPRPFP